MSTPIDLTTLDDQIVAVELSETLGFVADFLAWAEGPLLRADFADFAGDYTLAELRADLRRYAAWLLPADGVRS